MVKIKPEDLIEAMLDKQIQNAMAANTSGLLSPMIEELLTKKLEAVLRTCVDLKKGECSPKDSSSYCREIAGNCHPVQRRSM